MALREIESSRSSSCDSLRIEETLPHILFWVMSFENQTLGRPFIGIKDSLELGLRVISLQQ